MGKNGVDFVITTPYCITLNTDKTRIKKGDDVITNVNIEAASDEVKRESYSAYEMKIEYDADKLEPDSSDAEYELNVEEPGKLTVSWKGEMKNELGTAFSLPFKTKQSALGAARP